MEEIGDLNQLIVLVYEFNLHLWLNQQIKVKSEQLVFSVAVL